MPAEFRNVDCRHNCFPLTPLHMPKKNFPTFVPPMMAESAKAPFDAPDWIFEIKLDGYRAITVFDPAGKPHLWSRNGDPLDLFFDVRRLMLEPEPYPPILWITGVLGCWSGWSFTPTRTV